MPTALREEKKHTYGHYLSWPDDERWEIIEGVAYNMAPAPSTRHQALFVELLRQFGNFFVDKPCRVYGAPFDVLLPEEEEAEEDIRNVVQPDISVICDPEKIKNWGCLGAPDFIIEILSPSTAQKDRIQKAVLYERHRVKEYWIVDPLYNMVTKRVLEDEKFGLPKEYAGRDHLCPDLFPELIVDLDLVFQE